MIRQLSVLVENKPGSLMEVTSRLTEAHVNIRAVANFVAPDFGILLPIWITSGLNYPFYPPVQPPSLREHSPHIPSL